MFKLIDSASFFREDEPLVTVIDFNATQGLVKQAADSRIQEYAAQITPEAGKIYVHILAMGAGEFFGANRNADYFPEHNLIEFYKTFETSPAYIYRNHINKDPKKSIGKVLFAIYNERMHRVELIADIDKSLGWDVVERIEGGDFPHTSMACRTPYDVCSICGNKAHTRQEYCIHLREQLGRVYPDGRKVMALNVAPLKFFDMSIVVRPADVTSSVLQKVAFEGLPIYGSVEHAESENITDEGMSKKATIKKLSEFIKEIDGDMVDYSETLEPMLAKVRDPEYKTIDILKNFKLPEVFATMAHLGISPSISFLAELIARKTIGDHMEGVGSLVSSVVSHMGVSNLEIPAEEEVTSHDPKYAIETTLMSSMHASSCLPEYVEKRASVMDRGNVGYVGNGPHVEETAYEKFKATNLKEDEKSGLMKILHTIIAIGGAAVAAKWYITRTIEARMKEVSKTNANSGVKIILVKSASEYRLTYQLAKAAMVKVLKKQ